MPHRVKFPLKIEFLWWVRVKWCFQFLQQKLGAILTIAKTAIINPGETGV